MSIHSSHVQEPPNSVQNGVTFNSRKSKQNLLSS